MMPANQLSLHDLVRGLEHFGERYEAFDVFARDVHEVGRSILERRLGDLRPVRDGLAFVFESGGRTYKLRFHPSGIVRLTRAVNHEAAGLVGQAALGPLAAAVEATSLETALPSAVLGFLVGPSLAATTDAPKRVFPIAYDPEMRGWRAYDGPLARLLREKRWEVDAAFRSAG